MKEYIRFRISKIDRKAEFKEQIATIHRIRHDLTEKGMSMEAASKAINEVIIENLEDLNKRLKDLFNDLTSLDN